ncbi:hypothetical protein ACLB2K_041748 [Fragaria x ananassa]
MKGGLFLDYDSFSSFSSSSSSFSSSTSATLSPHPTVYSPHPTVYSPPPRALFSLKSSLDDPDSRLSSWTPNTSHCTWAGVTCDSHNHVTSLDLSGLNLSGYLSPDIAFLVYLSNLTLAENNFSGPIPPEISASSTSPTTSSTARSRRSSPTSLTSVFSTSTTTTSPACCRFRWLT